MKPQTINSFWRKPCADILYDFTEFVRVDQGNNKKRLWIWQKKKVRGKLFQDMDLRETQELIDITSKEQTEDNLREMSASEPMLKKMKKQCQKQTKEIDNGWPDRRVLIIEACF